ncbi:MAG: DUF169 domain-containing protein [Promethearchaeota archaeon]
MNRFEILKQALDLKVNPVGVKLIYDHDKNKEFGGMFKEAARTKSYCEYVKQASKGEFLIIKHKHLSCDIAEIMLGFKDSDNLELTMKLDMKGLNNILLFPINKIFLEDYDSVILIINPHNCMNIIQAYVRLFKKPLKITCGAINGVCSEITAYVIKRSDVNLSFLCPNSRKNGTFEDCELMCGIPYKMSNDLIDEIIKIIN